MPPGDRQPIVKWMLFRETMLSILFAEEKSTRRTTIVGENWSADKIFESQKEDQELKKVRDWMKAGRQRREVTVLSPALKFY